MTTKRKDDRPLPHDLEAERLVLGAILLHGDTYDAVAERLEPADFFRDAHGRIFAAMTRLVEARKAIEWVTLREDLERRGELDTVGGPSYVAALVDGLPRSSNIAHYAGIVLEKSKLRATIATATTLHAAAYDGAVKATELAADAAERLYQIGSDALDAGAVALADLIAPGMDSLERSHERKGALLGLSTGFARVDEMTGGLQPGDLVLVAARTSQGKTALAMNFVQAIGADVPVLVFSLEMSKEQLFFRMLASEARVDSHALRVGPLSDEEWKRISEGINRLSGLKVFIDDEGGIGVREVRARARKIKATHGLGAVVVDYIQLMKGRGTFDNRTQEIGTISRGLKAVARELNVPIIAISQLSRAAEAAPGRKARPPQLSDLAESASLENDADVVLLIYRPEPKADEDERVAEVIVAKQRNGPVGTCKLHWNKRFVRFENISLI